MSSTQIYLAYGIKLTREEIENIQEFDELDEVMFEDNKFIHRPYNANDITQIAIGVKLPCGINIHQPFRISNIPGDESEAYEKFIELRDEFLDDLMSLDEDELEGKSKLYLQQIIMRKPELYFYFGSS